MTRSLLRLGLVAALAAAAFSASSSATASTDPGYDRHNVIVISAPYDYPPAFDLSSIVAPVSIDRSQRDQYRAHRDHPASQRLTASAVMPSAVAGWRSGRVKRLAG